MYRILEAVFKEKGPYAGADYDLALYLLLQLFIREVMLSIPHPRRMPRLFLQLCKNEQPKGKGRVRGRGMEGAEADFMFLNKHFMKHRQPPCLS
jgi:hypothetical protein